MDFETSKLEFSIPAIIEINKKNYKGVIEANEKGLYFLSNNGQNSFRYAINWENAKYTRTEEKIRKLLFITASMTGFLITSSDGTLPKILIDENECALFIKGFQRIKNYCEEQRIKLIRAEEQKRINTELEEERRQIRLRIQTEKNERHIRLNNLLLQAEKERLRKESEKEAREKKAKEELLSRFVNLLNEELNRRGKQEGFVQSSRIQRVVLEEATEEEYSDYLEEQCRKNDEYCRQLEEQFEIEEERKRCWEEQQKKEKELHELLDEQCREEEERHRRLEEQHRKEEERRRFLEKQHRKEEDRRRLLDELRREEEKRQIIPEEEQRKQLRALELQYEQEKERRRLCEIQRLNEKERYRRLEEQRRKEEERRRLLEEQRREEEQRQQRQEEQRRKEEERRRLLEEQRREEEQRQQRLKEQRRKEEERRRLLEEQRREEEQRQQRLNEQRREEEERRRLLEEQREQEEKRNRLYVNNERRNKQYTQRSSRVPFSNKKAYHSIQLPRELADDELLKTVETEVNEFEYDNGNYIFRNDCLSENLHDFFQAYVLFQHIGDSLQFLYEYDVMVTALKYYNISSYLERLLDRVVEKALYDFQFDNEILIRILTEISDNCYYSLPSSEESNEELDYAVISFERFLEFGEKEYNNKSELREVDAQTKEIESQYYELEFGKWRNEKYERIHNYYNNLADVVISYIEKQSIPIGFYKLKETFKGLKKNTMRIVLNESSIIDLGNRYISLNSLHINKRILNDWQLIINRTILDSMEPPHIRIIYNALLGQYSDVLQSNYITDANQLFNLLSKLFGDEFSFKRPYVALEYQEIVSVKDRIISFVSDKDEVEIEDIQNYARNNYLHIGSLLKLFNSLSDYVLLKNKKTLIANYKLMLYGLSPYLILDKIQKELYMGKGYKAVRDLECISEFPNTSIKWDEWLIYSLVSKYSSTIYALTTSKQFKSAIPVVSLSPELSQSILKQIADRYAGLENITFDKEVDDLDNLDELIEDYIDLDDIDDLDDFNIDDGEFI